jgi:hypothetical protein
MSLLPIRATAPPEFRLRTGMADMRVARAARTLRFSSADSICLDPPPGELAEPITLREKLACVWKQLLAAPSQISVAVDLRSMAK